MLDEPTAALGVAQTAEVLNLIERVRDRGLGVIMISHNMEDVRAVADRIVVLRLGRNNGVFTPDASQPGTRRRHHRRHRQLRLAPRQRTRPIRPQTGGTRMSHEPDQTAPLLDRSDGRVTHADGLRRRAPRLHRPRAVGRSRHAAGRRRPGRSSRRSSPALNPIFLAPNNLVNLLFDCATVGVISLGIVCVLMLGEIDLSVGSMSGLASAMIGVLWVNHGLSAAARHPRRAGDRRADRRALRDALQPARACRASCRRCRACSRCSACSSTCSARPARSTCPIASPLVGFGQLLVMPAWLSLRCWRCCRAS